MTVTYDMSERDYHARTELSSTGVRRILDSPARYHYWETHPQPVRAVFELGTAAHTKILGTGAGTIVYPAEHLTPSGNVSTKKDTVAWADEQRANGLIPITQTDADRVDAMAEAVLANPDARAILERVHGREASIITTIDGVPARARFDVYNGTEAADLKTAKDASPGGFNRSVGNYGYFIQEQWYREAHEAETGAPLEQFQFIVVESARPHLVGVYTLDFIWEQLATAQTARARELWRECTDTGVWPGYEPVNLTPPAWALHADEEEEIQV